MHFYHHDNDPWKNAPPWALEVKAQLFEIRAMLVLVLQKENMIMSAESDALDQAEAAAKANSAADDSAEALLVTISQMIRDLQQNQTDPATAARINALATALNGRSSQLAAAVVANTPTTTTTTPPPVTPPVSDT